MENEELKKTVKKENGKVALPDTNISCCSCGCSCGSEETKKKSSEK